MRDRDHMTQEFAPGDSPDKPPFKPLRIGVVGSGSLGGAIGGNWVRAGHEVVFSSRHPEQLVSKVRRMGPKASCDTPLMAAQDADVVLFSLPYDPIPDLAEELADALDGKIVINASNQPFDTTHPLSVEAAQIGLGPLTQRLFSTARVAIAFSAVDAWDIAESYDRRTPLAVPIAADDPEAMAMAARLVHDAGCAPLVIGDLASSRSFMRGTTPFRANTELPKLRRVFGL